MILATGATGNVGLEIVKQLHDMGQPVRVISRSADKETFPENVEVITGDLTNVENVKVALKGVKKLFLIHVQGGDWIPQLAQELGIEHLVFLSSSAIESATENAIGRMHARTEALIQQSSVDWTFLRPDAFMSNSLQWARSIRAEGVVRAPFGNVKSTPIHPRDIASVAVKVLCSSGHEQMIYTLTGPELVTPKDQVQIIGDVIGKKVEFHNVSDEVARQYMMQYAPEEIVDALLKLAADSSVEPKPVLNTVKTITGLPAHTFKQWATDNAEAFL